MKARRLFFGFVIGFDLLFLIYVLGPRVEGVSMDRYLTRIRFHS
jgi:hypothetical protein